MASAYRQRRPFRTAQQLDLFHINVPRVMASLCDPGAYSFIAIGLNQVAKMNLQHGWKMGDVMLVERQGFATIDAGRKELFRLEAVNFVNSGNDGCQCRRSASNRDAACPTGQREGRQYRRRPQPHPLLITFAELTKRVRFVKLRL